MLGMLKLIFLNTNRSATAQRQDWYAQIASKTLTSLFDLSEALDWFSEDMLDRNAYNYMPQSLAVGNCINPLSMVILQSLISDIQSIAADNPDFWNLTASDGATISDSIIVDIQMEIDVIIDFTKCTKQYGVLLQQFLDWLTSLSFTSKNYSNAINAENVLVMFNDDETWLKKLLDDYSQNLLTKEGLIAQMNSDRQVEMMKHVSQTMTDINQLIIVPVQGTMSTVQGQMIDGYVKALQFIAGLYVFTANDELNSYARALRIWREPSPNLEMPQVRIEFIDFRYRFVNTWFSDSIGDLFYSINVDS